MQEQHAYGSSRTPGGRIGGGKPAQERRYVVSKMRFFDSAKKASARSGGVDANGGIGDETASLGQLARWLDKFPNEHVKH